MHYQTSQSKLTNITMQMHAYPISLFLFFSLAYMANPSTAALDSLVYVGCSQLKYAPASPYASSVTSILSSAVNSASISTYNTFNVSLPGSGVLSALFQCRGDLTTPDCHDCVADATGSLGAACGGATGGAVQLDGCYVRYDNASFVGDEDKSVVLDRCGPPIAGDADVLARRDAVLADLGGGGEFFRVGGSGNVKGVAQCTQDLSAGECVDCLSEAIQRLRTECGSSPSGDMFLGKCYARYLESGYTANTGNAGNGDEAQKSLAIFIGLVVVVVTLVFFLSYISRRLGNKGGK